MALRFPKSALAIVAGALAAAFQPSAPIAPSAWAATEFVVPDGEYAGSIVDLSRTPYLIEPLDRLGPDAADNEVAVMKSAQTGFTLLLQIAIGHSVDRDPCDMIVVQPTDAALGDFNSQKLGRAIEKTPVLAKKIRPQTARSGKASTTYEKKFGDNSIFLAIATSAADLSSKTIKKAFLDEVDRYPEDVDGQGSPLDLVTKRQTQFLNSGTWKRLYISTPVLKGDSAIEEKYLAGDQRRWHVPCPHCDGEFVFEFGPNFKYSRTPPHNAHYNTPCCGVELPGWQKISIVLKGRWVATAPGAGKFASYHFDALSSPFVPWDEIAAEYVVAGDDEIKLKSFYNLTLGLPYEIKGNTTDVSLLMQRSKVEIYKRGVIPPDALLLTVAADVQMRGIWYEVVAWTPDRRSYTIEADYLDGATTDHDGGAFLDLTKLYHREWLDSFGNKWRPDEFGLDSGFRSNIVYAWTRAHAGTKALKGVDGWGTPAIGGASPVDFDYKGRRFRTGAAVRGVGTWPLKLKFYTYLALMPATDGAAVTYPVGYCHFGPWLEENYFLQLTAEYVSDEIVKTGQQKGRVRKVWKQRREDNHFLDCRIYNLAMVDPYLATFTRDDWLNLAKRRGVPADMNAPQGELFSTMPLVQRDAAIAAAGGQQKPAADESYFERLARLNRSDN